mmetsp:Transcript_29700/g.49019  ORF Transcript_29700/g.49019 Transcript_29700/m.49019 type:complete len:418 (+) Transcript_29700:193-1446(+)|eukprot:CAMPEP_0119015960 /NCGR_PEP_ID=MMETSP1176-20130426/11744_1 /TAXON_ID=265551 /ORGANISM="Synedropsis recta cf, Strain CCMP1620" /LENGTH=417 /DNA_ID=CAMNT_0006969285 /DNA_START=148 /DNA_END=1401 /DNA_ORIENTATION=+
MNLQRMVRVVLLLLSAVICLVHANDAANDDAAAANDDAAAAGDDDAANYNDDAAAAGDDDNYEADAAAYDDDYAQSYEGDDYIKYWTEYAILPKRCIVYNNVDVIVFSVFEYGYKQCSDDPMGTYITSVPTFVNAYLDQQYQNAQDLNQDDYATPASYTDCTRTVIQNVEYWTQLGCTDGTSLSLSVNIYTDNECTIRNEENGSDDASIDVSDIQLPFKKCQACVNWVDVSDDQVDDQFYENHRTQAPLCSTAWQYKESCDRKCQKTGLERKTKEGWNTSDKILLAILALFGCGMLVAILQKRRLMSNKDALLEQAAMSAAGLQQAHVIGIFVLVIIVITVFALLDLKNLTWAMLLICNTVLFGYLMKLTIDSGVSTGETVIGPDGTIIRRSDSDDSSMDSSSRPSGTGGYMIPSLT